MERLILDRLRSLDDRLMGDLQMRDSVFGPAVGHQGGEMGEMNLINKKHVRRTTDTQQVISLLRRTPIFAQVSEEILEAMLKSTIQKTVEAGAKIVEQGKEGIGFYLILEGKAEVVKETVKLGELEAGDFFGELACIDGEPRTADVVAVADTTCLVITQWGMNSIIESCPGVALGMLKELVRRLRTSNAALDTS